MAVLRRRRAGAGGTRRLPMEMLIPMTSGQQLDDRLEGARRGWRRRLELIKIVIRGKGSVKEGRFGQKRDLKFDPSGGCHQAKHAVVMVHAVVKGTGAKTVTRSCCLFCSFERFGLI
ncbi:hypothetical protein L1987_19435 [Smallanthus sonchifolius]|uniref:Uncharacterized protein n=1 Tax=Smallanthus sonchifolius TaxID=185202 RepID=A0ACB9IPA2_9ASTR|nr:hypothetical protein L1987_19435 [Smallanthus sonchifolius]